MLKLSNNVNECKPLKEGSSGNGSLASDGKKGGKKEDKNKEDKKEKKKKAARKDWDESSGSD